MKQKVFCVIKVHVIIVAFLVCTQLLILFLLHSYIEDYVFSSSEKWKKLVQFLLYFPFVTDTYVQHTKNQGGL